MTLGYSLFLFVPFDVTCQTFHHIDIVFDYRYF